MQLQGCFESSWERLAAARAQKFYHHVQINIAHFSSLCATVNFLLKSGSAENASSFLMLVTGTGSTIGETGDAD